MKLPGVISFVTFLIVSAVAQSCTDYADNDQTPVPLPVAWPRLPVSASDSMIEIEGTPIKVLANPQTTHTVTKNIPPSLTLRYPAARTSVYYTFIPVGDEAERQKILAARQERISLNLNGLPAKTIHSALDSTGRTDAIMVVARSGTQTPVQLLASLPLYVVTATAFIDNPAVTAAYDSIVPLIRVLARDMSRSIPAITFPDYNP